MNNFLDIVLEKKKKELKGNKAFLEKIKSSIKRTKGADLKKLFFEKKGLLVIAEVKLSSPTIAKLGEENDVLTKAKDYEKAGADILSVVTEKDFFNGDIRFMEKVKKSGVKLPIFHKDFIIDPLQIYESKFYGADALLLIARILNLKKLKGFVELAQNIGLEPIVEVNNEQDLKKAISTQTEFIAINARDLDSLKVNVDNACALLKKIPSKYIKLGFSGISSRKEVEKYRDAGALGVLIGTSLMRSKNSRDYLSKLGL